MSYIQCIKGTPPGPSPLLRKLMELAPQAEPIHDDDDLLVVWGADSLAMLTKCTNEPPHWHGVLYGGTVSIRSAGADAEEAYHHLHARCLDIINALSTDASECSPPETAGRPGAEDVPDNHTRDGG